MRICFFIGSMYNGGAERVISILANHYAEKKWDVDIVLLLDNKIEYMLDERINILDFTGSETSYVKNLPFWIKKIRRYLKEIRPDRVVSFIGRINALVLMSSVGVDIPIIVSERNDPKNDGRSWIMLKCCNFFYKVKANAIVFQTRYQLSCFSAELHSKSFIALNPVEVKVNASKPKGYIISTAGRLTEQKNQSMLIDAIRYLKEDIPSIEVNIFGEGPLRETLQKKIDNLGLSDRIKLCGNVSNLHERIKNSRVFILTSEFEGLSNSLIEAMMLGLPCISTDYPGVDEIIKDGVNGIIIPRKNVKALYEALIMILSNDNLRENLSREALKTSKVYRPQTVINTWENIIEKEY